MSISKRLNEIQQQLKVARGQFNSFGNYNYRSCGDILEAVKPLLGEAVVLLNDDLVMLGDRFYIKATAIFKMDNEEVTSVAYAREAEHKKGMDSSQITGATSSYARKYALCGLFAIDDTKDADATNKHQSYSEEELNKIYCTLSTALMNCPDLESLLAVMKSDSFVENKQILSENGPQHFRSLKKEFLSRKKKFLQVDNG